MGSFEIEWKRSAIKELRKLPAEPRHRVVEAVESLAGDPRPHGSREMVGSENN